MRCQVLHGSVVDSLLESCRGVCGRFDSGGSCRRTQRPPLSGPPAGNAGAVLRLDETGRPGQHTLRRVVAAIDYSGHSAYRAQRGGAHRAPRGQQHLPGAPRVRERGIVRLRRNTGLTDRAREREAFDRFTAPLDTAAVEVEPVLVEGVSVAESVNRLAESIRWTCSDGQQGAKPVGQHTLLGSESEGVMMESENSRPHR